MKGGKLETETNSSNLSVTKKPSKGEEGSSKVAVKDPNKPKRPTCAFFLFMEDFCETFKKENPNDIFELTVAARFAGEKWKSMSESQKAPYLAIYNELKVEYEKNMEAYYKKLEEGPKKDEESDKKLSVFRG